MKVFFQARKLPFVIIAKIALLTTLNACVWRRPSVSAVQATPGPLGFDEECHE